MHACLPQGTSIAFDASYRPTFHLKVLFLYLLICEIEQPKVDQSPPLRGRTIDRESTGK